MIRRAYQVVLDYLLHVTISLIRIFALLTYCAVIVLLKIGWDFFNNVLIYNNIRSILDVKLTICSVEYCMWT